MGFRDLGQRLAMRQASGADVKAQKKDKAGGESEVSSDSGSRETSMWLVKVPPPKKKKK